MRTKGVKRIEPMASRMDTAWKANTANDLKGIANCRLHSNACSVFGLATGPLRPQCV